MLKHRLACRSQPDLLHDSTGLHHCSSGSSRSLLEVTATATAAWLLHGSGDKSTTLQHSHLARAHVNCLKHCALQTGRSLLRCLEQGLRHHTVRGGDSGSAMYLLVCRAQLSLQFMCLHIPLTLALTQLNVLALQTRQLLLHRLAIALSCAQLMTQLADLQTKLTCLGYS